MDRDRTLNNLETGMHDLLVIGGGITGAGVAREASLRGYRVVRGPMQSAAWMIRSPHPSCG